LMNYATGSMKNAYLTVYPQYMMSKPPQCPQ
jgi:hypothetical protein